MELQGIAPTLIIIRVALGVTSEHTVYQSPATGGSAWQVNVHPSIMRSTEATYEGDGQSTELKTYSSSQGDLTGHRSVR